MEFNFNFESFEKSGKDKQEAINYLKSLNSNVNFKDLETSLNNDTNAIYESLKKSNFSFSKPSQEQLKEQERTKKINDTLKEKQQTHDIKKAIYEKDLENENALTGAAKDTLKSFGVFATLDLAAKGLEKLGFKSENYLYEEDKEAFKKEALKSVRDKINQGKDFQSLNTLEKHALTDTYQAKPKEAFESEKEKVRLDNKDGNFTKEDMDLIKDDLGFFNSFFNSKEENIKEFKEKRQAQGIVSDQVIKAINTLKQFDEGNLLKNMIFSNEKEQQAFKENLLKDAYTIAELNGFDNVALDAKDNIYFIKTDEQGNEQKYLVNTGFIDNFFNTLNDSKFEISGGIAGSIAGAKRGKNPVSKAINSIAGAALGSFTGALTDAALADLYLNRESNYKKNLDYALQAGLLSTVGDGLILGAYHTAKPIINKTSQVAKHALNYAKERTPLGFLNTIPTQNIAAAEKIINQVFTEEQKQALKEAQKTYGGSINPQDLQNNFLSNLKNNFAKKYGKDDPKTQSIEKLEDIFNQNSIKQKQQNILDLVRSDQDGTTLAYLLEIAKDDPKIQNNLKNILNHTSRTLEKNLSNLNINPKDIKNILDEFENGNKQAFKEVEDHISTLYNDKIKVVLPRTSYEKIKSDMLENGIDIEEATPFLKDLENNVFSRDGVTFAKLNNFRKNLNYYIFNKDKTPNFSNTIKKIAETHLKNEIDKGIDNIFNELPQAYSSIKELYSTSLKDYAAMKELNESIKKLGLQDKEKTTEQVVDNLIKFAKGQGENNTHNLQQIKNYLGKENNAFLEMQILNKVFKDSLHTNQKADLKVFDSENFLSKVKELTHADDKEPIFKSKEAKEFLDLIEGFNKLYKNDAQIAKNFQHSTASKLSTSIATTAEGAIHQKVIKGIFDPIFRLLPEGILFGMFSKQIQGGALRYHLKKALSRSLNPEDFKLKFTNELKKTNFNSNTRTLIDNFINNLDTFNKEQEGYVLKKLEAEQRHIKEANEKHQAQLNQVKALHEAKEKEQGKDAITGADLNMSEAINYKPLNQKEKIFLKDNDDPLNIEYVIINKNDLKPNFETMQTQGRTIKQERLIKNIIDNFNPDLLVNIKGDLKRGNPIILKDGQILAGNHRSEALQNLSNENLAKYKQAVKDNFNIDLKDNEILARLVTDTDENKIKKYAFASNEGLESNLSEQSLTLFSKYKTEIDKLKATQYLFNADDIYNMKNLVLQKLGEKSLTKLDETNKALFYSLLKGSHANVVRALQELEKHNLEDLNKILSMFYDNAGGFYNLTHDISMPSMSNLQDLLADAFVRTANQAHTRAIDFTQLIEKIKLFLQTDLNALLQGTLRLQPTRIKDFKAEAIGVGLSRFTRLENPNTNLFDFLNEVKPSLIKKGQPDLFDNKGIPLAARDEYDFIEELLLQGQDTQAKFDLIKILRDLREFETKHKDTIKNALNNSNLSENTQPTASTEKLKNKTTSQLDKNELKKLDLISQKDFKSFLENIENKQYKDLPIIIKIANLNQDLNNLLNSENASVFLTRARAAHIAQVRKAKYNQALSIEEKLKIPQILNEAKSYYKDNKNGYIIPFKDELNENKINLIILDKDSKGNFLITAKKIDKAEFESGKYTLKSRTGVEPAITTQKIEHKPTEATSLDNANLNKQNLKNTKPLNEISSQPLPSTTKKEDEILKETNQALNTQAKKANEILNFTQPAKKEISQPAQNPTEKGATQETKPAKEQPAQTEAKASAQPSQETKTTKDIIKEAKLKGLSVKQTKEAIEQNKALKKEQIKEHIKEQKEKVKEATQPLNEISSEALNPYEQRLNIKALLKDEVKKDIINQNTQEKAQLTLKGIAKMLSNKAIQKSVKNGFTEAEHFEAVKNIKKLFEKAQKALSKTDEQDQNLLIHRYNAPFKDANALLTLKEYQSNGKKIYSLELENLEAVKFNPSGMDPTERSLKSKDASTARSSTPINEPKESIAENLQKIKETKEFLKNIKKAQRQIANSTPNGRVTRYRNYHAKTKEQKHVDYYHRLNLKLKYFDIDAEYYQLEALKRDKDLSPKELKEQQEKLYLAMYENIKKKNKAIEAAAKAQAEQIKQEQTKQIHEWLENNQGATSNIEKHTLETQLKTTKDIQDRNKILRQLGILSYKENGNFGKVDLEYFGLNDYEIDLPFLKQQQAKHEYSDILFFEGREEFKPMLNTIRKEIEARADIKALAEFGTNYAEFYRDGKGSIEKLLKEQNGQVAGAFYREDLGDIDLIWGEVTDKAQHKGYGLAHIIDKRQSEFLQQGLIQEQAQQEALNFVKNNLSDIIQNGTITNKQTEALKLETPQFSLILKQNWQGKKTDNKWIVTAYYKKGQDESISSTPFTEKDNLFSNPTQSLENETLKPAKTTNNILNQERLEAITEQSTATSEYFKENLKKYIDYSKQDEKLAAFLNNYTAWAEDIENLSQAQKEFFKQIKDLSDTEHNQVFTDQASKALYNNLFYHQDNYFQRYENGIDLYYKALKNNAYFYGGSFEGILNTLAKTETFLYKRLYKAKEALRESQAKLKALLKEKETQKANEILKDTQPAKNEISQPAQNPTEKGATQETKPAKEHPAQTEAKASAQPSQETKTTKDIIKEAKLKGLSVKQTKEAIEQNKAIKKEQIKEHIKEQKEKVKAKSTTKPRTSTRKKESE